MTGQYITFDVDKDCVANSRAVARLPGERKWAAIAIEKIAATPCHLHGTPEQGVSFTEGGDPENMFCDRSGPARRIYSKGADFKAFGFSERCPKCDHARRYGPGRTTDPYSEQCRQRVMLELMKTPGGVVRVNQAMIRGQRSFAEKIENQPAQGEIVDGVRGGLLKAGVGDARFEGRVERTLPPIESEPVPPV